MIETTPERGESKDVSPQPTQSQPSQLERSATEHLVLGQTAKRLVPLMLLAVLMLGSFALGAYWFKERSPSGTLSVDQSPALDEADDSAIAEENQLETVEEETENLLLSDYIVDIPLADLPETIKPLGELPEDLISELLAITQLDADERMETLYGQIHTGGSGYFARAAFPDLEYLFAWSPPEGSSKLEQHSFIYPFRYYYSPEADVTFVVCNIDLTVAICEGQQNEPISARKNVSTCTRSKPYEDYFGS